MENVVLVIHLILALCLIAVVLLQRSEGGALGIGGGGGGMVSQRGATSALSKVTWAIAAGFICTSLTLTILAGGRTESSSVLDSFQPGATGEIPLPGIPPSAEDPASLLPPAPGGTAPAPATPPTTPPTAN